MTSNASFTIAPVLSVIASHCVHDDPTSQSHLRPYGGGSASDARFNEERADLSTRIEGVSPLEHHPCLRLSTNAGNVNRRNNSCGGGIQQKPRTHPHANIPRVACKSSALIVSPPSTRSNAHDLTERATESRLIRKARLIRNISQ